MKAYQRGEVTESGVLATRPELDDSEGGGASGTLLLVVGEGDSLVGGEELEGLGTTHLLVGEHTSNSSPEDLGWGAIVSGSTAGVGVKSLVQECLELLYIIIKCPLVIMKIIYNTRHCIDEEYKCI